MSAKSKDVRDAKIRLIDVMSFHHGNWFNWNGVRGMPHNNSIHTPKIVRNLVLVPLLHTWVLFPGSKSKCAQFLSLLLLLLLSMLKCLDGNPCLSSQTAHNEKDRKGGKERFNRKQHYLHDAQEHAYQHKTNPTRKQFRQEESPGSSLESMMQFLINTISSHSSYSHPHYKAASVSASHSRKFPALPNFVIA